MTPFRDSTEQKMYFYRNFATRFKKFILNKQKNIVLIPGKQHIARHKIRRARPAHSG